MTDVRKFDLKLQFIFQGNYAQYQGLGK